MANAATDEGVVPDRTTWLFLIAGVLAAIFGVNTYLTAFWGTFYEPIQAIVGPAGFLVGVVGLFSLYSGLASRTPLAHLAGILTGVTILAWILILVGSLGEVIGVFSEQPAFVRMASMAAIFGMLLSFGSAGLLSVWSNYPSRLVGGLLLVESTMFLFLVARLVPAYVIDTGHVLAFLGIAVALWSRSSGADRTAPTAESTP